MISASHTWSSPTNSYRGRIGNCNCSDGGEHSKHAKEHVDGHGRKLHGVDDVGGELFVSW